jgi:WD40 repeat protein/serine/threonine protein kinase
MGLLSKFFGNLKKTEGKGEPRERRGEKPKETQQEPAGDILRQETVASRRERKILDKHDAPEPLLTEPIHKADGNGKAALQETVFEIQSPKDRAEEIESAEAQVPLEWNIGDTILDLYEVTDILGKGGMGVVYKVHHKNWNLDLAVKSPLPEAISRTGGKENFVREAETWVNLGLHPNTVSCHYVRTLGGAPRVFAEFVDSGSLKDWIESKKLYRGGHENALERIIDIAIQFAWGLDYAHEQGLVHQDIKPANVMMTADVTAKVTDFGLAKARPISGEKSLQGSDKSILVTTGGMTEAYCSPEQYEGKPLSRKTDIWSWGVSILEMFTGEATWRFGFAAAKALEGYIEHGPDDPDIPSMPTSVSELLNRCFQNGPESRPATMGDVADALKPIYQEITASAYARSEPKAAEFAADGLNNMGVSYFDLGRKEDAISCWEKALEIKQIHPEATYNLSLIQWRDAKIDDLEVLRRLDNCGKNQRVNKEKLSELVSFVHAERLNLDAAKDVLKAFPGKYEALFSAKDINELRHIRTMVGHTDWVTSVAITPDGRYAVSGSTDKTLQMWDLETGRSICIMQNPTIVKSVAITPDGRYAVSGSSDKTLKMWDLETCKWIRTMVGHTDAVTSVAITPDGRYAVSGSGDDTIRVWDLKTRRGIHTMETYNVTSVAITPDGRYAVSGSTDKTLQMWDLETGRSISTMKVSSILFSLAITPDAKYLVSGSKDRLLRVWEISFDKAFQAELRVVLPKSFDEKIKEEDVHAQAIRQAEALYKEGNYRSSFTVLYDAWEDSGFSDKESIRGLYSNLIKKGRIKGLAICFRFQKGLLIGHINQVTSVAITPDGRYAVSGSSDKTLRVWDFVTGRCTREIFCWRSITSVAITPDGRYAVSGGYEATIRVWELETGKCIRTIEGHTDSVESVSVTPNGRYVISGSEDKTLRVWDLTTGQCIRTMEGHTSNVISVTTTPDGRYAVSGSEGGTIRVWELETGKCIRTMEGHTDAVTSVAITPDGRYAVSGSLDKTLQVWELIWDLEFPDPVDWDEGLRPYIEIFLTLHKGYWNETYFSHLTEELASKRGYGWVRPEGIRRELEKMT